MERKPSLTVVPSLKVPVLREEDVAARHDVQKMERFLRRLALTSFYGKIVVSMQSGKIVDVRLEQAVKIEDL